jgi:hypothetical protein
MKKSELLKILSSASEDEVLIDVHDVAYEIEIGHLEESFDGFDTLYPACITLKPIETDEWKI